MTTKSFMKIAGIQKLTLLDFPGLMAATIFTNGCNFMCPFCHNSALVIDARENELIDENEIFEFLESRKGKLDGICITGGEPLLQNDLIDFIKKIKSIGYKVKLDTNGYVYPKLKEIIESKAVDYVAMDIKNSLKKYPLTTGIKDLVIQNISKSISLLKENYVEYEFRTTVVKELHDFDDIKEIAELIKGCSRYYLQQFEDTPNNIQSGYSAHDPETLKNYKNYLNSKGIYTEIRGI